MPTPFPSDFSHFLKTIETPLNLQILFHLMVFNDLTVDKLSEKMRSPDKTALQKSLTKMVDMGLVENYTSGGESHFRTPSVRYSPKEYEEYKDFQIEQLRTHLNEEFIYSLRMISLLKSIFGKLVHYTADFYINRMQNEILDPEKLKQELKYDTSVPRIGFVSKDEFELYKTRFKEFEDKIIEEILTRRKSLGIIKDRDIEYIIANLFIPIKKVIDHK